MTISFRQGDVYLKQIDILPKIDHKKYICTEGIQIEGAIILAHGEVTGHKHAIYDGNAILVKSKDTNDFFLMVIKPSELKHEEHDTITLPIGNYKVVRQREYSPTEIRRVAD
jgi:hypothetical protein